MQLFSSCSFFTIDYASHSHESMQLRIILIFKLIDQRLLANIDLPCQAIDK